MVLLLVAFLSSAFAEVEIETIDPAPAVIVRELPQTTTVIRDTNKVIQAINRDAFDENTLSTEDLSQIEAATMDMVAKLETVSGELDQQEAQFFAEVEKADRPVTFADIVRNMKALTQGEAVEASELPLPLAQDTTEDESDAEAVTNSPALQGDEADLLSLEDPAATAPDAQAEALQEIQKAEFHFDVILPSDIPLFEALSRRYRLKSNELEASSLLTDQVGLGDD